MFLRSQAKPGQNVAYYSMEYAISSLIRLYSGGLGVLAGDTVKSAADLGIPLYALGILWHEGYFRQSIVGGQQVASSQEWRTGKEIIDLHEKVAFEIAGQTVRAKLWGMEVPGIGDEYVPLILLDTRRVQNHYGFEGISSRLYEASTATRLYQEMLLGIGGVRALRALDLKMAYHHLNEGHAAFAPVELLKQHGKAFKDLL
ncbi:MAG TPA: glycogen/starch/alpha-glucan phosphorylase, partial [Candidatus Sulfotelmatobacter sp.]|nr:glycogen/starch/alpha-glucan phosphorylase [Candidatus Sulfotelmatobacter sp.]